MLAQATGSTPGGTYYYHHDHLGTTRLITDSSGNEFARYFGKSPDKLGLKELRTYQAYLLKERKLAVGSVVNHVAALRFFFVRTLKRSQFRDFLPYPREYKRLPIILSKDEVARLINASGNLFRRAY